LSEKSKSEEEKVEETKPKKKKKGLKVVDGVIMELSPVNLDQQSVTITENDGVHGAIHRNPDFKDELLLTRDKDITTLYAAWKTTVEKHGEKRCLGTRIKNEQDGTFGEYDWQTYDEVNEKATYLASAFVLLGFKRGDKIGIYAKNNPNWVITEMACNIVGLITVALYDTFGPENLEYCVNHAELRLVVGSYDKLLNLLKNVKETPLKHLVALNEVSKKELKEIKPLAEEKGIEFFKWSELLKKGKQNPCEPTPAEPDDLAILMYTSGTTGHPKGVMLTNKNMISTISAGYLHLGGVREDDVYLSYLPLAHILERVVLTAVLHCGASVGFYSGDIRMLREDMQALKPTMLAGVPRVFDKIYESINTKVESKVVGKVLFKMAYKGREKSIDKGKGIKGGILDDMVFKKAKKKFGGHIRLVISGGAPLSVATHKFVSVVFGCPVMQGYGLTETCGGTSISHSIDRAFGKVGPPLPCCEIKLVSVPEMNYLVEGEPSTGEIWIRGNNISKGYFKDEAKTKEDFDENGWFHSGDIGRWNDDGTLSIIDRKKNIFKLSQGEYICAEVLESIYNKNKYTTQLWIYGSSLESTLVAVAAVNPLTIHVLAKQQGVEGDVEEVCKDNSIREAVLEEINVLAKANNRQPFEFIKKVHLHHEEFNTDNDLATPTMKLKRPQLQKYFEDKIQAMYEEIKEEEQNPKKKAPGKKLRVKSSRSQKKKGEGEDKDVPQTSRPKKKNTEDEEEEDSDKPKKTKPKKEDKPGEEESGEKEAKKSEEEEKSKGEKEKKSGEEKSGEKGKEGEEKPKEENKKKKGEKVEEGEEKPKENTKKSKEKVKGEKNVEKEVKDKVKEEKKEDKGEEKSGEKGKEGEEKPKENTKKSKEKVKGEKNVEKEEKPSEDTKKSKEKVKEEKKEEDKEEKPKDTKKSKETTKGDTKKNLRKK